MSIDKPGKDMERTVNPGDRISDEPQTLEEKAQQLAVDHVPDITGDVVTVPTYVMVEKPDGEKEALHHVKDADKISDVIRQAGLTKMASGFGIKFTPIKTGLLYKSYL